MATNSPSELEQSIIRQLEYYFSDSNLYRDKFLQEQIGKDDGWVPVSTLLTFKRLAALSEDAQVIVAAIEKSDEGLVQVSEDKLKLRRHPERPLPEQNEEVRKEIISRTVYVKGFPLDTEMGALIEFFQNHEKVSNIVMRKYLDKSTKEYKFKGSVFATFVTKEQAETFLGLEEVKYREAALIRKWQNTYVEEKKEERSKSHKKKNAGKEKEEEKIVLAKGATLHLEGFDPETTREAIKEAFPTVEGVQLSFVEFNRGDSVAYVRFSTEGAAKKILEKIENGKLTVQEKEIAVKELEGEDEEKFLAEQVQQIKVRRENFNNKSKFKGKGGRKFGGGRNKRRHDGDGDDEAPRKK